MANFLLIGICIIAGMLFRHFKTLPEGSHKAINTWIIYLALPAVSFKYLPHIEWSTSLLLPALAPVLVWFLGWIYIRLFAQKTNANRATESGLKLSTGLSNTSFIGFPLVMAYFRRTVYWHCSHLRSNYVYATRYSGHNRSASVHKAHSISTHFRHSSKKCCASLLSLGCLAALTIPHFIDFTSLNPLFDKLASTVGPLALFSIGLQLQLTGWQTEIKTISTALLFKLILAPIAVLGLTLLFKINGIIAQISIFEMAMPPLLTASVIADEYQLNPKLVNLPLALASSVLL
jgi:predicted permease